MISETEKHWEFTMMTQKEKLFSQPEWIYLTETQKEYLFLIVSGFESSILRWNQLLESFRKVFTIEIDLHNKNDISDLKECIRSIMERLESNFSDMVMGLVGLLNINEDHSFIEKALSITIKDFDKYRKWLKRCFKEIDQYIKTEQNLAEQFAYTLGKLEEIPQILWVLECVLLHRPITEGCPHNCEYTCSTNCVCKFCVNDTLLSTAFCGSLPICHFPFPDTCEWEEKVEMFVTCINRKFTLPQKELGQCEKKNCRLCLVRNWWFHKKRLIRGKFGLCVKCGKKVHRKGASWCAEHQKARDEMYADADYENMMLERDEFY